MHLRRFRGCFGSQGGHGFGKIIIYFQVRGKKRHPVKRKGIPGIDGHVRSRLGGGKIAAAYGAVVDRCSGSIGQHIGKAVSRIPILGKGTVAKNGNGKPVVQVGRDHIPLAFCQGKNAVIALRHVVVGAGRSFLRVNDLSPA